MATRFRIDDELAELLAHGNSMVVATRSAALEPHATRACGLSVLGPQRIAVLLPVATSERAVANLRDNGSIAVCISSPRTYRTVQLKGRARSIGEAADDDLVASERLLAGFQEAIADQGFSRQQVRNLWQFESWRVEIEVTSAYAQTPGPGAGARMEGQ